MMVKASEAKYGYKVSGDLPDQLRNEFNSYFESLSHLQSNLKFALAPTESPFDKDNPVDAFKHALQQPFSGEA